MQLEQRDGTICELQSKMLALQADFEHNLALLDGRDKELVRAEAAMVAVQNELASKVRLIQQMQAALAEAEQGRLGIVELWIPSFQCTRKHA